MIQSSKSGEGNNSNQDQWNIQKLNFNLNNPGEELKVNKVHRTNNFLFKKPIDHIRIINIFPSC